MENAWRFFIDCQSKKPGNYNLLKDRWHCRYKVQVGDSDIYFEKHNKSQSECLSGLRPLFDLLAERAVVSCDYSANEELLPERVMESYRPNLVTLFGCCFFLWLKE